MFLQVKNDTNEWILILFSFSIVLVRLYSWCCSHGFYFLFLPPGGLSVVCIVLIWNYMTNIFIFNFCSSSCDSISVCDCLTMHPNGFNLVNCLLDCGRGLGTIILIINNISDFKKNDQHQWKQIYDYKGGYTSINSQQTNLCFFYLWGG